MKKIFLMAVTCVSMAACTDNSADSNGDGIVNADERTHEMLSDAFIESEPGLWETKTNFTEIDMPAISERKKAKMLEKISEGFSSTSCLSPEDAKQPDADFFGGEGSENCMYERFDMSGQLAEIAVICTIENIGDVKINLNGKMEPTVHAFDTELKISMPGLGDIGMNGTVERKHVGECPID